jgi:hypothetical protein
MKRLRLLTAATLFLSLVICNDAALEAADPPALPALSVLKVVPEDALAVVVVSRLDRADERLGKLAAEMQLPIPSVLPLLKSMSGVHEGLDERNSAVLAILPGAAGGGVPAMVKFIPVTDYGKFISQLHATEAAGEIAEITLAGQPAVVGHKGDFAVVASKADRDAVKSVLASVRGIAPVVGSLSGWIGEH